MEKGSEEKYGATLCALRSYKSIGFFQRICYNEEPRDSCRNNKRI